ncbi:MAG: hypothetical protein ACLFVJ_07285 [Persicimonas sp.]
MISESARKAAAGVVSRCVQLSDSIELGIEIGAKKRSTGNVPYVNLSVGVPGGKGFISEVESIVVDECSKHDVLRDYFRIEVYETRP